MGILESIYINFLVDFWWLVTAVAYVAGMWLMLSGFFELKRLGDYRSMMYQPVEFKGPIAAIFSGACLIWLPALFEASTNTMWDVGVLQGAYPYDDPNNVEYIIFFAFEVMKVLGVISFIRGWLLLSKAGTAQMAGQGVLGRGILHLLAGVTAYHLFSFIIVICNTIGVDGFICLDR